MNKIRIELRNEDLIRYDAELVLRSLKDFIDRIEKADEEEKKNLLQLIIKKYLLQENNQDRAILPSCHR